MLVEGCSDQQPGLTMVYHCCGISWVGVTDPQMLYTVNWSDTSEASNRYGFVPPTLLVADAALLKAASPLANAARITAPLPMACGANDRRVPLLHGEKFHAV